VWRFAASLSDVTREARDKAELSRLSWSSGGEGHKVVTGVDSTCLSLLCLQPSLRQGLTLWPRLASNSLSSYLSLPSAGITVMHLHMQQKNVTLNP
jgi:hypothetical protein